MKKKYRYQDENGQWIKGFYDEKEIEELKSYGYTPEEVQEYYDPNDEDKDNPYYNISEAELTDFMQLHPGAILKSDYELQQKQKKEAERLEYQQRKLDAKTKIKNSVNEISLNQQKITDLTNQIIRGGDQVKLRSEINALNERNKALANNIKRYDEGAYNDIMAIANDHNTYLDQAIRDRWSPDYVNQFWKGSEKKINEGLGRVSDSQKLGETISTSEIKKSNASNALDKMDEIRKQIVTSIQELEASAGSQNKESLKAIYTFRFDNFIKQAEALTGQLKGLGAPDWQVDNLINPLKWYKEQALNQLEGYKNFGYIYQDQWYNNSRNDYQNLTSVSSGGAIGKTSYTIPEQNVGGRVLAPVTVEGVTIPSADDESYYLNRGNNFSKLSAKDFAGFEPWAQSESSKAGADLLKTGFGSVDLSSVGKVDKVVKAAMDDYFTYYEKINPEFAKKLRSQYEAYSKSTDLSAYQEKEKLQLEQEAFRLAMDALNKDLSTSKTNINILSDGFTGVNFQKYNSDMTIINKEYEDLKLIVDKIGPINEEFEAYKKEVEENVAKLDALFKTEGSGITESMYQSYINDYQKSLNEKAEEVKSKIEKITKGRDVQKEMQDLQERAKKSSIENGITKEIAESSKLLQSQYQQYEATRDKLKGFSYMIDGWEKNYPTYSFELEKQKKSAEFRAKGFETEGYQDEPWYKKAAYYGYKYFTPAGLLQETEIGKGFSSSIGQGILSISQIPEAFSTLTGGTNYGWTDQLYDWYQDMVFTRSGKFGDLSQYVDDVSVLDEYLYMGGNVGGSLLLYATGGSLGGSTKIGQFASTFTTTYLTSLGDTYTEMMQIAKENNMSPQWAAAQSQAITILQASVESLIPDVKYLEPAAFRKSILSAIRNGKTVKEAFKEVIDALPDSAKALLLNQTKEGGEELTSTFVEDVYKEFSNKMSEVAYFNDTFDPSAYFKTAIGGVIGGTIGNFMSRPQGAPQEIKLTMYEAAENADAIISGAKNEKERKKIESDLKGAKESLANLSTHTNWNLLNKKDKVEAFFLSQQISDLQGKIDQNAKNGIQDKASEDKLAEYQNGLNTILNSITENEAKAYQKHSADVDLFVREIGVEADFDVLKDNNAYKELNDQAKTTVDEIRSEMLKVSQEIDETKSDEATNKYLILQQLANTIMTDPSSYKNGDYPWRVVEDTDNEIPMLEDKRGQYVSSRFKDLISEDVKGDEARKMAAEEWLGTEDGKRYSLLTQNKDDQKNKQGLPSEEQQGKEPVQAKSVQGAGTEETPAGGVVQGTQEEVITQAPKEEVVVEEPTLEQKELDQTREQITQIESSVENIEELDEETTSELEKLKEKEKELSSKVSEKPVAEDIESKKVEIENRREEELNALAENEDVEVLDESGNAITIDEQKAKINSKYDAELAELETETEEQTPVKSTEQVEENKVDEEKKSKAIFNAAASFASRLNFIDPSMLMAKMKISASEASKLMESLYNNGVISQPNEKGLSEVLMKPYQVANIINQQRAQEAEARQKQEEKEMIEKERAEMTPEQIEYENKVNGLKGDIARMDPTLNDSAVDTAARLFANGLTAKEAISKAKAEQKQQTRKERKEAAAASRVTLPKRGTPKGKPVSMSDAIGRLGQALKSSGIDVQVAETQEEYDRLAQEQGLRGGNTEGFFVSKGENPRIVFNKKDLEGKYGKVLLFHEGTHPIVNIIRNTNPKVYNKLVSGLNTLAKKNKSLNKVRNEIKKAVSPESFEDEFIVESLAQIASGNIDPTKLDRGLRSALINFMNDIAKYLGLGQIPINASTDEFLKLANQIKDAFEGGRDISEIVGEKNVKTYERKYIQPRAIELLLGKENLSKYGIEPGKKYNVRDIYIAFEKRQRELFGQIKRNDYSDKTRKQLAEWAADEVAFMVEQFPDESGKGWYTEKFQAAIDEVSKIFPELKEDKGQRSLFTMLVAIYSDGTKVDKNMSNAIMAYSDYRETGVIPNTTTGGERNKSFNSNINEINKLIADFNGNLDELTNYLLQEKSGSELAEEAKQNGEEFKTDWPADMILPVASRIFGPKLGMFYSNLMGKEGYPTLDRWFSRLFNRYRGDVLPKITGLKGEETNKKGELLGLARFKSLIGSPNISDKKALELAKDRAFKFGSRTKLGDSSKASKMLSPLEKQLGMKQGSDKASKDKFKKAAKSAGIALKSEKFKQHEQFVKDRTGGFWTNLETKVGFKQGATEDSKKAFDEAAEKLGITPNDKIYGEHLADKSANTLYKAAFVALNDAPFNRKDRKFMFDTLVDARKMLAEKGIDVTVADIQAILWYYEKKLYVSQGGLESAMGISYQEAAKISVDEYIKNGGELDTNINKEDLIEEDGDIDPEEVQPSTKIDREIDEYIDDLQKTKDADPEKYWSVDVPPASDVKSGTFIKDADGAAFVDENGDVRGLYKFPSSEQKGVGDRIVKKAIAAGGIKLDNFDIYLSNIYLKNGFKIASRIPFNPELAPKGYVREKGATKDPDVVFMVYDPYGKLGIEDKMFDDYGDALEYRESFIPKQQEVYGNTLETKDVRNEKIVEGEPMSRRPMMDMGLPASEVNVRNIGSIKNVLWASEIDSKGEVSRPADLISNMGGGKNEAYVYAIYNNQELSPRNTEEIISELYNLYEADLNKKLYKATDVEAIKILNDKINDEGYTEALNRYFDNIKDKNEFIEFKTVKEETDFIYGLFSMTAEYMSFSGMTKSNVGSGTVRILGRSGSDISGGVKITPEMIETLKEAKENGTEVEVLKELLQITDENPYIHVSSLSPKDYADRNSIPYESKESKQEGAQPSSKIDREVEETAKALEGKDAAEKNKLKNISEPTSVTAEDGWTFVRMSDGSYTDGDQIYDSWESLKKVGESEDLGLRQSTELEEKNGREIAKDIQDEIDGREFSDELSIWNYLNDEGLKRLGYDSPMEMSDVDREIHANLIAKGVDEFKKSNLKLVEDANKLIGKSIDESISVAYHKAKADGSNPELVKAVEDLLGKPSVQPSSTIDRDQSDKQNEIDNQFLKSNGVTELDVNRWLSDNKYNNLLDPKAREQFNKDFGLTLPPLQDIMNTDQLDTAIQSGIDDMGADLDNAVPYSQAFEKNIKSKPWYNLLTQNQKNELSKETETIYAEEYSQEVGEQQVANITPVEKASKLVELYYKKKDNQRGASVEEKRILESDEKLKYIWQNIPSILRQLENNGILTKTTGCP